MQASRATGRLLGHPHSFQTLHRRRKDPSSSAVAGAHKRAECAAARDEGVLGLEVEVGGKAIQTDMPENRIMTRQIRLQWLTC